MTALATRARFDASTQARRSMIAKVHVAQKTLGLAEDDYRAVLFRVTGNMSARDCTNAELAAVIAEFGRQGFQARPTAVPRPAMHRMALKARALWISLHQLGVVRDPSEKALEAFAKRQLGVVTWHRANQALGYKLIEALKAMAQRAGWDQSTEGVSPAMKLIVLKKRLALLLLARLKAIGTVPEDWDIAHAAERLGAMDYKYYLSWTIEEVDLVIRALAAKLAEPMRPVSALELVAPEPRR